MPVQKRYKVKNMNTGALEEVYAFNDAEVLESYRMVGHEVKIVGVVDLPGAIGGADDPDPSQQANLMAPNVPGGIAPPPAPKAPPPQELFFSANGMDFKLTPEGVFVKTWVDIEDAEYRILSKKTGRENSDYRVQVKDWVKTEDPNNVKETSESKKKDEPENGEEGEKILG